MGTLLDRLADDLKDAMRAGDAVRRDELRGLIAAIRAERQSKLGRELDRQSLILRGDAQLSPQQLVAVERLQTGVQLSEDEEQAVLRQRVKQHRQSIEAFQQGRRQDLVAVEEAQLATLNGYLPEQIEESAVEQEIQAAIQEAGAASARDLGKVMGLLARRLRGRADMKLIGNRVQALLNGAAE